MTIKNDGTQKLETDQKGADPYFKFTSEVKKDQSPRVPSVQDNKKEVKIKCQMNLNKVFGNENAIPANQKDACRSNKENKNENTNGIKLPGKFNQSSKGVPILIKTYSKVPPKAPKH